MIRKILDKFTELPYAHNELINSMRFAEFAVRFLYFQINFITVVEVYIIINQLDKITI